MRKLFILTLTIFLASFYVCAQDTVHLKKVSRDRIVTDRSPQVIFAELGGNGIILSANYDRRFSKTVDGLGLRFGLGYSFSSDEKFATLPLGINYLLGKKGRYFEMGLGGTFIFVNSSWKRYSDVFYIGDAEITANGSTLFAKMINVGYRRQPINGGFNFRGGVSPFFLKGAASMGAYLSVGYNF